MAGIAPTVDTVIRVGLQPNPQSEVSTSIARMTLLRVVERLAHAHVDDVGQPVAFGRSSVI